MDSWSTFWTFVHAMSWSVYVGGAVVMEFVWRPAQQALPPSQTAVACQWMGRRYRWVASAALLAAGLSGAARLFESGYLSASRPWFRAPLTLSDGYGRTMLVLVVLWLALLTTVTMLTFIAHPALHTRMAADLTDQERRAARERVARAIRRMDRILRFDLYVALVALLLGASLSSGGLL